MEQGLSLDADEEVDEGRADLHGGVPQHSAQAVSTAERTAGDEAS